jgi:hypothetical protein
MGYSEIEAKSFLTYLTSNQFIKPIAGTFPAFNPLSQHYQWHKLHFDSEGEPGYAKQQRDADRTQWEYARSVRAVESIRLKLDTNIQSFITSIQQVFLDITKMLKSALSACMQLESLPPRAIQQLSASVTAFLESIEPEKELKRLVEKERTGFQPLPTFCYKRYGESYSCVTRPLI